MFRYFLASLLFFLVGCATINFQSIELSCPNLPNWALVGLVASAAVSTGGLVVSEWLSLSKKTQANGIVQLLLPMVVNLYSWIKSKFGKGPPKPST